MRDRNKKKKQSGFYIGTQKNLKKHLRKVLGIGNVKQHNTKFLALLKT